MKLEILLNSELHIIHKKGYKKIDSSPDFTTAFSDQWFTAGKTAIKMWVLIKTPCKNSEWKLNCDNKHTQKRKNCSSR